MTTQSASPTGVENRWYGPTIRMFFVTAIFSSSRERESFCYVN